MQQASEIPYGRKTQRPPALDEVPIIWMTAGLGCDGDSVSITAAMQPSFEDVVMGAIPGLSKVHLHNPVLAYENGDEFIKSFRQAASGELENFVLVMEGSIPNENLSGEGYWAAQGEDPVTRQPIKTTTWIDRLAPKALAVVAIGTCATYGGICIGSPCRAFPTSSCRSWMSRPAAVWRPTASRLTARGYCRCATSC